MDVFGVLWFFGGQYLFEQPGFTVISFTVPSGKQNFQIFAFFLYETVISQPAPPMSAPKKYFSAPAGQTFMQEAHPQQSDGLLIYA